MQRFARVMAAAMLIALLPSRGWSQATDRSEMDQWLKDSQNQGELAIGTKVTIQNWQQYRNFLPLGMQEMFAGKYFWKIPPEAVLEVGPTVHDFLLKSWIERTEKYSPQTTVELLPNGHYVLHNYHGGTPFPNPSEPYKGWKVLANINWPAGPQMYVNGPNNYGSVWAIDRYGNVNATTLDVVYRVSTSDYISDPGIPASSLDYLPGVWYTEWLMEESPEQARYTASLNLFYIDQEKQPFPDTYVFVPALRRSLRLASTARCSPVFGFDWTYDDAKGNGFNGSTSIYTGDFLGDRKILTLAHFNQDGAIFPGGYLMPLGFPKPSWGKWEVRDMAIDDVHRISSEASGYCYSSRIMYADKEHWLGDWVDLFDSNHKLWKSISYYNGAGDVPGMGHMWEGISSSAMDFQNSHETVWCGFGNPWKRKPYIDINVPKEYFDGVKYGSPGGLQQIMR
ncbi:MAG TPA: DUF1329 domain-containing protein [Candidatus Binataceae bacterium]|nr:DUF1329 domain-containing protein [Candidatus Binataceae bacterium]